MKNIILVGMMSSGKTTLGKKLARALNYRFVDLDKLIEADQGMPISTIFSEKGEPYFREIENKVLKEVSDQHEIVLASGGGTPCFYNNMEIINAMGLSIYLDVSAADLARRIESHGKDDRPILSGAASLKDTLEKKIMERTSFYLQARFTLKGEIGLNHLLDIIQPLL